MGKSRKRRYQFKKRRYTTFSGNKRTAYKEARQNALTSKNNVKRGTFRIYGAKSRANRRGYIAGMNKQRKQTRGDYRRGYRHGKLDARTKK